MRVYYHYKPGGWGTDVEIIDLYQLPLENGKGISPQVIEWTVTSVGQTTALFINS